MQRTFWGFLLLIIIAFSSCVPNKNYVYLQKDDVNKKELPKDTILRKYSLQIHEYKIQPLDLLSIRIESLTADEFDFFSKLYPTGSGSGSANSQAFRGFLVDESGIIEFPVIGEVKLAGLSVFQAQDTLQKKFSPYLKTPVARVQLLNFRFTILGEVNSEQQVTSVNTRVTLMEAIGMAGGLTDMADRANVKIVRQKGLEAEVFYINLLEESVLSADKYYIQQNDIIVVPALRQRPFRRYWGQNIALLVSTISVILFTVNLLK